MKLKAATLLETIVSSLVFLIVFGLAMDSVNRIKKVSGTDWTQMEKDFNACRDSLVNMAAGKYQYTFSWGILSFDKMDEGNGLMQICADVAFRSGQHVTYQYLWDE